MRRRLPPAGKGALRSPTGARLTTTEHQRGCLLCGADLVYRLGAVPVTCARCGAAGESRAACQAGHFVCDRCHAGEAREVIERTCAATRQTDPVVIAQGLMRHPSVALWSV